MTPSEPFMGRKLRITLDALRPKEQQKQGMCQNKDWPLSVGTPVFERSYRPGQPNWTPGTIHKKKRRFIYSVQVGDQFWAQHKNPLRYTSYIMTNNKLNIPLDWLVDTFELLALSPVKQTNINKSNVEPRKKWPKRNRIKVMHLQINPKHAR